MRVAVSMAPDRDSSRVRKAECRQVVTAVVALGIQRVSMNQK